MIMRWNPPHYSCDSTWSGPPSGPSSFELLPVRVVSGSSACVVIVIYCTGPVTTSFFTELSDDMDRVATTVESIYVVGDLNIRLDHADDPWSRRLTDVLASYGLSSHVSIPTHDRGGLLDIVASRDDLPTPSVDVIDVGLSDHRLLRWSAPLVGSPPVYTTAIRRSWSRLDAEAFRAGLLSYHIISYHIISRICSAPISKRT